MKLDQKEYKRFLELKKLVAAKKASEAEKSEFAALEAKKNEKGSNDIKWWSNYPSLLKDVVNLPFNWIPGTNVEILNEAGSQDELGLGLLAIAHIAPSIGISKGADSPFNMQIRQLWLDLHRKYRGIGTYQAADLGIAIIAINSLFETISKFERIYGVLNTYHIANRVVPYQLINALRIDLSVTESMADFRYSLNLAISKAKQLCLPKGLSVLESDIVTISNLFKDSENKRAFIFGFDIDHFGVYDPSTLSTGGSVKFKNFDDSGNMNGSTPDGSTSAFLLSDILNVLNEQINALLQDDDIARICSDLLAAYGPENVMTLASLEDNYQVEPVHDYERLVQFHNLTICDKVAGVYDNNVINATDADSNAGSGVPIVIYQKDDSVICELARYDSNSNYTQAGSVVFPTYPSTRNRMSGKSNEVLFDTWVETPGAMEIMCGTRYTSLIATPVSVSTNVWRCSVDTCGTKVVEYIDLYYYDSGTYHYTFTGSVVAIATFQTLAPDFVKFCQMDWHPHFYITDSGDLDLFGDVDNFTMISAANLSRLHEVALLSGYKIPMVSGFNDK